MFLLLVGWFLIWQFVSVTLKSRRLKRVAMFLLVAFRKLKFPGSAGSWPSLIWQYSIWFFSQCVTSALSESKFVVQNWRSWWFYRSRGSIELQTKHAECCNLLKVCSLNKDTSFLARLMIYMQDLCMPVDATRYVALIPSKTRLYFIGLLIK